MPAIAERPPAIICQTATAVGPDSKTLFHLRESIMLRTRNTILRDGLVHVNEEFPIDVEADFPHPMTIAEIADQHHRFLASLNQQYYDVEVLDDPA